MKTWTPCLLFLMFLSCENSKDFRSDFIKHKYDLTVINNLTQYDTLRQIILNNYNSFNLTDTKKDFTYIYNFDTLSHISGHSNSDVPKIIYPQTVQLFERIGKENIFGFTISKDSTLAVLIRNKHLTKYFLDVRERLYWYPATKRINKMDFPFKDTMLTDKWQYVIWYDKRAKF